MWLCVSGYVCMCMYVCARVCVQTHTVVCLLAHCVHKVCLSVCTVLHVSLMSIISDFTFEVKGQKTESFFYR